MNRSDLLRPLLVAMLACAAFPTRDCAAQDLADFEFSVPPDVPRAQAIAPGGTGSLAVTVRNPGATSGYANRFVPVNFSDRAFASNWYEEYEFVPEDAGVCAVPEPAGTELDRLRFRIGPLAPGAAVTCRYEIRRAASSREDLALDILGPNGSACCSTPPLLVGSLPDLSLSVTRETFDPTLLRITVANTSPYDIVARDVTTNCAEFEGGIFGAVPLDLANDFPGACPGGSPGLALCLSLTGQNFLNRSFLVGPLPAGTAASCRVRIRGTGFDSDAAFRLFASPKRIDLANGGTAIDPSETNDDAVIGVPITLNRTSFSGAWYESATSGQGFVFESYAAAGGGQLFGGWFTHATDGSGTRWFSVQGPAPAANAPAPLVIYANQGGDFASGGPTTPIAVGTATLTLYNCRTASLAYRFDGGASGTLALQPLVTDYSCTLDPTLAPAALRAGTWFEPARPGQGITLDLIAAEDALTVFAIWYTYVPDGAAIGGPESQRWYSLQGTWDPATSTLADVAIFETRGGRFDLEKPRSQQTVQVGTGRFDFRSCDSLALEYTLTDGASAGRAGTLELVRTGPVPDACE